MHAGALPPLLMTDLSWTKVTFQLCDVHLLVDEHAGYRSEVHTYEFQSHSEISSAVICMKEKNMLKNDSKHY